MKLIIRTRNKQVGVITWDGEKFVTDGRIATELLFHASQHTEDPVETLHLLEQQLTGRLYGVLNVGD